MKEPITTEKVTDTALTRSLISSVIGIVLCMACLFGTTWAWYSSSVTSGVSVSEGANFDFDISIEDSITPTDGVYTFEGGEHTVTLTKTGTAEKGFCKVEAKKSGEEAEATTYYIVDFTGEEPISFIVKGSGTLKLIPMLGTPAEGYNPIPDNGIELTLDTVTAMLPQQEETPTDGETGTFEGITTEGGQTPPDAGETPPGETPTNSEPAESGTPTELISEATAEQPVETPAP